MGKYRITYTGSADSSGQELDKDLVLRDTKTHIKDVIGLFHYFMRKDVFSDVKSHDHTKIEQFDEFFDNLNQSKTGKLKSFHDHNWWKLHANTERHHALDYTGKEPINLGHIIHMLCDWVAAGSARSDDGKFQLLKYHKGDQFDKQIGDLLLQAFDNTLEWLANNSVVRGFKKDDSEGQASLSKGDEEDEEIDPPSDPDNSGSEDDLENGDTPDLDGDADTEKVISDGVTS